MQNENSTVRLTFKTKTARHDFMATAIKQGGFSYKLDQKSVLMAAHDEARLKDVLGIPDDPDQQYDLTLTRDDPPRGRPVRPLSYQELQQSWARYVQKVNNPTRNSVFDLD